jgi:hypothetical protein
MPINPPTRSPRSVKMMIIMSQSFDNGEERCACGRRRPDRRMIRSRRSFLPVNVWRNARQSNSEREEARRTLPSNEISPARSEVCFTLGRYLGLEVKRHLSRHGARRHIVGA